MVPKYWIKSRCGAFDFEISIQISCEYRSCENFFLTTNQTRFSYEFFLKSSDNDILRTIYDIVLNLLVFTGYGALWRSNCSRKQNVSLNTIFTDFLFPESWKRTIKVLCKTCSDITHGVTEWIRLFLVSKTACLPCILLFQVFHVFLYYSFMHFMYSSFNFLFNHETRMVSQIWAKRKRFGRWVKLQ